MTLPASRSSAPAAIAPSTSRAARFPAIATACPTPPPRHSRWLSPLGLYAYRRDFLLSISTLPRSPLEAAEKLEQLRVLEAGYPIAIGIVDEPSIGIDTPEDYRRFVSRFRESGRWLKWLKDRRGCFITYRTRPPVPACRLDVPKRRRAYPYISPCWRDRQALDPRQASQSRIGRPSGSTYRKDLPDRLRPMPGRVSLEYRRPAARAAPTGSIWGILVCSSGILLLIKEEVANRMPTLAAA